MTAKEPKKKCKPTSKAEVAIVLDSSTSVGPDNWKTQLSFVQNLLRPLHIAPNGDRVGLVTFNTYAKVEFGLTKYKSYVEVATAVKNAEFTEGITATGDALQLARTKILSAARPGVPKILFLVTDGKKNFGVDPIAEAGVLKKQGVKLITVGITSQIDM